MDGGFDDLLVPSRNVLEENPFEDPFAQPRSGSPDPWATYGAQSVQSADDYEDQENTTPTTETAVFHDPNDDASAPATANPLDSESASFAADKPEMKSPRSPGFREDVSTEEKESVPEDSSISPLTPTVHSEMVSSPKPLPSSPPQPHTPSESSPVSPRTPELTSHFPSSTVSPASLQSDRVVISPLEQPAFTPSHVSFASLSLGGETLGGWQGTQSTFINEQSGPPLSEREEESVPATPISPVTDGSEPVQSPSRKRDNTIRPEFVITVHDPQKVGDPIRSFTMYTVHTKTTSPLYSKPSFSVLRRYSDFLWLYETLSSNNPGVVVPPVPEKSPFGRFENQFVEQRRLALEKCIQKTANHPVLAKDVDLKMFLESDTFALDIKHRKAEIAQERGGLMATIGQTITGPKFYETDEWFDKQKAYLDHLESQLRGLVKAIDLVSKQRAELAIATGEFANVIGDLSGSELSKQLSHSLAIMSDVERKAQDVQHIQAQEDVVTIMSTVDEYARLINSVRLAFSSRIRTYNIWKSADNEVIRVKQAHEKARAQGRIPSERLGHSLSQIADAERRALEAKQEFSQVSRLVKTETARFEQERVQDFKESLEAFLEGMITRQKEVIASWESYQELLLKKVAASSQRPPNTSQLSPPAPS